MRKVIFTVLALILIASPSYSAIKKKNTRVKLKTADIVKILKNRCEKKYSHRAH